MMRSLTRDGTGQKVFSACQADMVTLGVAVREERALTREAVTGPRFMGKRAAQPG